ncbi:MAG TPA: hypothetical protein PLO63_02555 [Syntrophales bacterium]|mgnify:CR=1 FL=1|jgi:hypothetical protein|nr:hypothetical protein [Syntrophales bacterium]
MKTIAELEREIRNYINNPRKQYALIQNKAAWNMLCSCLDLIDDTELAIEAYELAPEPDDQRGKYLLTYGILQSLFLQQDAVCNLCEALNIEYSPDMILRQIREIRNDSIGHPTKRGGGQGKAFNFISRTSMSKKSFQLMTTYANGQSPLFRTINISSLIRKQQKILMLVLVNVLKMLDREEAEHKAMLREDCIIDAFPSVLNYYFEKLYEAAHGSIPAEFGSIHIKLISEVLEEFKRKLDKRGILYAYDSIKYNLDLLVYPIAQLKAYFAEPSSSDLNNKSAHIFIYFIKCHVEEIKKMAEELDGQYNDEA